MISRVTLLMTLLVVLITLLVTTPEPPGRVQEERFRVPVGPGQRSCIARLALQLAHRFNEKINPV